MGKEPKCKAQTMTLKKTTITPNFKDEALYDKGIDDANIARE